MLSGRRSLTNSKSGAKNLVAIFIVVVLLASTVGAFVLITGDTSASGAEVKIGSKVKVDYVGKLPNGEVFDTSLLSVAKDNVTNPKSPLFTYRGDSLYTPFELTVGAGGAIQGFEYGILGLKVGESRTLTIPTSQGYGESDPAKIVTIQLTEEIPVYETMTAAQFKSAYGETATSQRIYTDPIYGWQIRVISVDTVKDEVLVRNEPVDGATYRAYALSTDASYGWDILVERNGATITVHHQLASADAGEAKGYDKADGTSGTKFVVKSVDTAAGTAVIDKNSETVGVVLTFEVTIVSIS